jgi:hypothetical protein
VILQVLKEQKRLTTKVYDNEAPIENLISFNINEKGEFVFNIPYPASEREKLSVIHEQLRIIVNNLYRLNENKPEKQYLKLFELRYNQNLKNNSKGLLNLKINNKRLLKNNQNQRKNNKKSKNFPQKDKQDLLNHQSNKNKL